MSKASGLGVQEGSTRAERARFLLSFLALLPFVFLTLPCQPQRTNTKPHSHHFQKISEVETSCPSTIAEDDRAGRRRLRIVYQVTTDIDPHALMHLPFSQALSQQA